MKRMFSLWLLLGMAVMSFAQTITVMDQSSEKPLEAVTLTSDNPQTSVITNSKGQANLSAFKGAEYIMIRLLGYKMLTVSYNDLKLSGFKIALEQSIMNLDQVVISATRWRQSSGNVPSKITTISPKEVALQNPQTAADLLGASGKVFVQKSQQGGGSPMIRGFATNRLIYTVDGVRMNTAIFRGGNIQNVINIDPFATESTEVLFGPGSVIYGSDAIGGVMSFQTLTPQLSMTNEPLVSGNAITRYSSANNEKTGHFDVNIGWEKWALVTSVSAWDYDHLRQGSHGPSDYVKSYHVQRQDSLDVLINQEDPLLQVPSGYSQINMMQKVRFQPTEYWDFEYGFHYSATTSYGRYDRHNRIRAGSARYGEWNYGPQKWLMNNLSVSHSKDNFMYDQMTLRLAQQSFAESRISRDLNSNTREKRFENVEAYSANLDLVKSTGSRNTVFYGVEFIQNDVTSKGINEIISNSITQRSVVSKGPARYPNSTWNSLAAYLNSEFRVSDQFTIQGGIRYNQFMLSSDFSNNQDYYSLPFKNAEINNGALTGSIGGVFKPSERWSIKANLGTAFRSPNVDDIGKVFDTEPGAVVVPNPDLKAEYAYNVDVGIAKVFGDWLKVDVTGYYTLLQNAMVRRSFQLNGQDSIYYDGTFSQVQAIQNAAVANVYGVQAGLEMKLIAGFTFLSDYNYQVGQEELDDGSVSPSRHAAPMFGVARLRYERKQLTLEINTMYQGERSFEDLAIEEQGKTEIYAKDDNGNNYSPGWYTLNLKALYQLSETFRISGGLENITDQRYRPYSSGLSGSGRNFVLSLRASF
ncbi:MAG: TonB-dependent receptor [Salibacteraceae bacterium]